MAVKFKEKVNLGPKVRKRDFYLNSFTFLSIILGSNIMSILFLVPAMGILDEGNPVVFAFTVVGFVVVLNYYFLLMEGKYDKIIVEYDKKFIDGRKNRLHMLFVAFYFIASVVVALFAAKPR